MVEIGSSRESAEGHCRIDFLASRVRRWQESGRRDESKGGSEGESTDSKG